MPTSHRTGIRGIDIEITNLSGKWKLSQNKEDRDRINAAEELRKRGHHLTATAMLNAVPHRN
jgi:transcriptional regulator